MQWLKGFLPVVTSLLIGVLGAIIFSLIKIPLPWLLGAIVAIAIASRFPNIPLRSPKMFSAPARAVLGITIGSALNPTILHYLGDFISSIVLILPFVLIITLCGMLYYWN